MAEQMQPVAPEVSELLRQASAMRRAVNLACMVRLLEQAARIAPGNAHILHDLGLTLLNVGMPGNALPYLDRAVALDPKFGHAHFRRGVALEAVARPGAGDAYQRAIVVTPDLAEAYARRPD